MSEITLSHNLQQLMRIYGNISVSEIARLTEVPQPTIHHILTGATKNPRRKALEALSKFFSVSTAQLLGEEELPTIIPETVKNDFQISTIPIIEWHILQKWPLSGVYNKHAQQVLVDKKIGKTSFVLIMPDTSMEPSFRQHELLIFDSDKIPKDRDYVIAYLERENIIAFNRLFIENNESYLRQELNNGDFKLIKLNKPSDRILGTLIETRTPY